MYCFLVRGIVYCVQEISFVRISFKHIWSKTSISCFVSSNLIDLLSVLNFLFLLTDFYPVNSDWLK